MVNSVYALVCEALSGLVSRRAAESMVRDALRSAGTSVDRVTAREMRDVLKGPVLSRLQAIIPVAQARGEIRILLGRLEAVANERRPLGPEVLEGLDALRAEFAPFAAWDHPLAARLRAGLDALPEAPDPVRALNALWDELAVLQLELSDPPLVDGNDGASRAAALPAPAEPRRRGTARATPEQQELLMTRFALEEGVVGVVLCDRLGTVRNARLADGSADRIAGVSAATAMLLDRTRSFSVYYTHLGEASVFIAPLGDELLTVLADGHVNVGRVLSEVGAVKEEP